jgi:hypothetical protein
MAKNLLAQRRAARARKLRDIPKDTPARYSGFLPVPEREDVPSAPGLPILGANPLGMALYYGCASAPVPSGSDKGR